MGMFSLDENGWTTNEGVEKLKNIIFELLDYLEAEHMGVTEEIIENLEKKYSVKFNYEHKYISGIY